MKEPYRYKVHKGYGIAEQARHFGRTLDSPRPAGNLGALGAMRIDILKCPGGDLACPGFEIRTLPENRDECKEQYEGFLCGTCSGQFMNVNNECISCPGINWPCVCLHSQQ